MRLNSTVMGGFAAALAAAFTLGFPLLTPGASAQTKPEEVKASEAKPVPMPEPETIQTLFLTHASDQHDLNDIQTDLRNMLPRAKIYGVQLDNAITLKANAEDMETAQKLVATLDQQRKMYRLTYTITDIENGKRAGVQHFVLLAVSGQRSIFKQGRRVPIATGLADGKDDSASQGSQVQYADVGLNIEATMGGSPSGLNLRTKIEQSSVEEEKSGVGAQDPLIHQTVLDESSELEQGKPLLLGSLDLPGTTRRQEIEVTAELLH